MDSICYLHFHPGSYRDFKSNNFQIKVSVNNATLKDNCVMLQGVVLMTFVGQNKTLIKAAQNECLQTLNK